MSTLNQRNAGHPRRRRGDVRRARDQHARSAQRVVAALRQMPARDGSPRTRRTVAELLRLQRVYAADAEHPAAIQRWEHKEIDPTYGVLEASVDGRARTATAAGLRYSTQLRHARGEALTLLTFAFAAGLGLLAWLTRLLLRFRRRLEAAPPPGLPPLSAPLPPPPRGPPPRRGRAPRADRDERPAHRPAQPPRVPGGP